MDNILSQVTLCGEPHTFSFNSYKIISDSEDSELGDSRDNIIISSSSSSGGRHEEPATAGEHTPGSPSSAIAPHSGENTMNESDDALNTPVTLSSGISSFFGCAITSMPDPLPISGRPYKVKDDKVFSLFFTLKS